TAELTARRGERVSLMGGCAAGQCPPVPRDWAGPVRGAACLLDLRFTPAEACRHGFPKQPDRPYPSRAATVRADTVEDGGLCRHLDVHQPLVRAAVLHAQVQAGGDAAGLLVVVGWRQLPVAGLL